MTKLVDLKIAALREINAIIGLSNRRSKDENVRQIIAFMNDNCGFEGPYTDESVKSNFEIYKQKLEAIAAKEAEFKSESSSDDDSSSSSDDSSSSNEAEYDPDPAVRYADNVDDSNPADDEYEHSDVEEEELADDEEEDKSSASDED